MLGAPRWKVIGWRDGEGERETNSHTLEWKNPTRGFYWWDFSISSDLRGSISDEDTIL